MRIAAMVLLLSMTCAKAPSTPSPTASQTPVAPTSGPRVVLPDHTIVAVEIAADEETRAQGLMYRDQLRPNAGMLFFFPEEGEYPFWMKNTRIPLDMIWIDSNRKIVHVAHDVPPCQIEDCPSYPPNAKARYVLEVAAGVAKQHGLKDGDVLQFVQTEDVVAR
ncbi:MAG TPA: DUF192 domain-containing protein [Thermoanaerobaculia bacterium]|nr:DUF192 domain-containing protein [Thermoanaerobaculia bacterium]